MTKLIYIRETQLRWEGVLEIGIYYFHGILLFLGVIFLPGLIATLKIDNLETTLSHDG